MNTIAALAFSVTFGCYAGRLALEFGRIVLCSLKRKSKLRPSLLKLWKYWQDSLFCVITAYAIALTWETKAAGSPILWAVVVPSAVWTALSFSMLFPRVADNVEITDYVENGKCSVGRSLAINYKFNYLDNLTDNFSDRLSDYYMRLERDDGNTGSNTDSVPYSTAVENRKEPKLYILIPKSGSMKSEYTDLSELDRKLEFMTDLKAEFKNCFGHRGREFKNTVYRISGPIFNFIFTAEFATPLSSISRMSSCSQETIAAEVSIFYNSLNEMLTKDNVKDGNIFSLIYYDDKRQSPSDAILHEIKGNRNR